MDKPSEITTIQRYPACEGDSSHRNELDCIAALKAELATLREENERLKEKP